MNKLKHTYEKLKVTIRWYLIKHDETVTRIAAYTTLWALTILIVYMAN